MSEPLAGHEAIMDSGTAAIEAGHGAILDAPTAALENGQGAILGPGTGPLPQPNGAQRDPSDDEMSEPTPEEIIVRQAELDRASAEFMNAEATGVYNENGEQLFADGTYRPEAPAPFVAPIPEFFDIASNSSAPPLLTGASSRSSTPRRQREEPAGSQGRAASPRYFAGEVADVVAPAVAQPTGAAEPVVSSVTRPVRQQSLKRSPRSVSPRSHAANPKTPSGYERRHDDRSHGTSCSCCSYGGLSR